MPHLEEKWTGMESRHCLDKQCPGVGFILHSSMIYHIPETVPVILRKWYDQGRVMLVKVLTAAGWVLLVNLYVHNDETFQKAMNEDVRTFMQQVTKEDVIIMGDLNADNCTSAIPREALTNGWRNLGAEGGGSQATWTHGERSSAIDTIPHYTVPAGIPHANAGFDDASWTFNDQHNDRIHSAQQPGDGLQRATQAAVDAHKHKAIDFSRDEEIFNELCDRGDLDGAWLLWNQISIRFSDQCSLLSRGGMPRFRKSAEAKSQIEIQHLIEEWTNAEEDNKVQIANQWVISRSRQRKLATKEWQRRMKSSLQSDGRDFHRVAAWPHEARSTQHL